MHGLAEYEALQPHEEIQREAATEHPAVTARANRETRPYVVRDLSWELARYLDTQTFPASAYPTRRKPSRRERT
jgi:hypothetical protein